MVSEDIVNERKRDKKLTILCKSQGWELKEDDDRTSIRGQAKRRIEERRRLKENG